MKIDEDGVCYEIEKSDVVDGTLIIPEGVKKIEWGSTIAYKFLGDYYQDADPKTFFKAKKLCEVADITKKIQLPKSLIEIAEESFAGFSNVETLDIPDNVTKIGCMAFDCCSMLKHISLSRKLDCVPERCFSGCSSLETLIIPDSVTEIGEGAFRGCTNLEYLYFGKNISKLDVSKLGLGGCHLKEMVLPRGNTDLKYIASNFIVDKIIMPERSQSEKNPSGRRRLEMEHIKRRDERRLVQIEDDIDIIGEFAFSECENLEEIIIGNRVKSIERGAFAFCPQLKRVVLPRNLQIIGNDAFRGCTSLSQIDVVSDLDRIGDRAFYGCDSLMVVDMQGKVGEIGEEAFVGCENLEIVTRPKRLGKIKDRAFKDCKKLISIPIVEGVETIGESAFENCCSAEQQLLMPRPIKDENGNTIKIMLENETIPSFDVIINIPSETKEIGESAFAGCRNLVYVHMNEKCSLNSIKKGTFSNCDKLQAIDFPEELESIDEKAFSDCTSLARIDFPKRLKRIGSKAFKNCSNLKLVITDGEIIRETDSFDNTNIHEGNIDDLNLNLTKIEGKVYEKIGVAKEHKEISISSIKNMISKLKNKDRQR